MEYISILLTTIKKETGTCMSIHIYTQPKEKEDLQMCLLSRSLNR